MSGRDEQPSKDFPVCPWCDGGARGHFWRGSTGSSFIYFDRMGYEEITDPRVTTGYGTGQREATLKEVNRISSVSCGNCNIKAKTKLFVQVIELGRKISVGNG